MEFEENTPTRAGNVIVGQGNGINSQVLRQEQITLENELRNYVLEGDVYRIMKTREKLNLYPDLITATEIKEVKQSIEQANKRLKEIQDETYFAEQLKAEKVKLYDEQLKLIEAAGIEIERKNQVLYLLDTERDSLLQARREFNEKLKDLIEKLEAK